MSSVFYRQRPGWEFPTAVRGEGACIWDREGRRLIDAAGGAIVVNVGHGVAEIAEAIADQARRLAYVHGSELTSEPVEQLAAELARRAPVNDARFYLVAGGSEAGLGLMAAVEIVRDQASLEPYPAAARMAQRIQAEALRRGVIVYASGGQAAGAGDLVMLGPPLVITDEQVEQAVSTLGDAIAAATRDR